MPEPWNPRGLLCNGCAGMGQFLLTHVDLLDRQKQEKIIVIGSTEDYGRILVQCNQCKGSGKGDGTPYIRTTI